MGRGVENERFVPSSSVEKTDEGFSEAKLRKRIESPQMQLSTQGRDILLDELVNVSYELVTLLKQYQALLGHDTHQAQRFLEDILKVQKRQQELFEKLQS